MKENEIVPGFTLKDFEERLNNLLSIMDDNSLFILGSKKESYMSPNVKYPYRQDSNFYYLCGVSEPECYLVIRKNNESSQIKHEITLYVREKSKREFFHGVVNGVESLQKLFGNLIEVKPVKGFLRDLQGHVRNYNIIYHDPDFDEGLSDFIVKSGGGIEEFRGEKQRKKVIYPDSLVSMLRSRKSASEIAHIKKCASISAQAFTELMKKIRPGMSEAHVEAILEFECRIRGAQRLAYPPVIGSGDRANIIHYLTNNHLTQDGDLIRIDAAAEYYGYMNDITRTFPVNGKFTAPQRKVYEAVLDIQKKCIEYLKKHTTETITVHSYHDYSYRLIIESLSQHFNISKSKNELCQLADSVVYPHMVGHPTGMWIHEDIPTRDDKLGPGMIITCEPGIYFSNQVKEYIPNSLLHGIGVQIEDDILLTEDGIEVLSHETPKEVEEIEEIMARGRAQHPMYFSF
ncbi:predicted protein [Naegleria gruberi]|uniref:Predicted protein n=1 Tax=Naegleria gruberi TaxID=5762 RepID=D2V0M9_NAEGR|nr:uncharacterized protein NAEGRDRAFT_29965 [Naegleria gruberi]EFC49548.1 predicted protein [Naegleria gruberi]|eukprot:XP_002682292.1 predicted protein [Naegleria gruberi strain NEG-M]